MSRVSPTEGVTGADRARKRWPGDKKDMSHHFDLAQRAARLLTDAADEQTLARALERAAAQMGFRYFALTQHVPRAAQDGFRLHTYPRQWERMYDAADLGPCDPVHRASQKTSIGFCWTDLEAFIDLTEADRQLLRRAEAAGLGDGFTVPAHVPGEVNGSCTFVTEAGRSVARPVIPAAQLVGAFGFEAARRLWRNRHPSLPEPLPLTERQRDCVLWMARGKGDWAIGRILGISKDTVSQHLQQARERVGVDNRTSLAVRCLFAGIISFSDIFRR